LNETNSWKLWRASDETTTLGVLGVSCCNVEVTSRVDIGHFFDMSLPIRLVARSTLDDTERIDPEIMYSCPLNNLDDILKGTGQF